MGVLKDIEALMTAEEIAQTKKEYFEETSHLREAKEALAKSLAEYVSAVMKAKNISQNDLRRDLGMSSKTMTEIVNGKGNPTIETIARFGVVFGVVPKLVWEEAQE